jgi:hypothetical protein
MKKEEIKIYVRISETERVHLKEIKKRTLKTLKIKYGTSFFTTYSLSLEIDNAKPNVFPKSLSVKMSDEIISVIQYHLWGKGNEKEYE